MQLPEPPPPPLAPLWDRVLRAQALPPDLDVQLLYIAIRDRLIHPEWEVRLHALRVLADLLPLSGNALSFPFDQVVDNLGHNSPNVRKAALDALKVFCTHCEDPDCAMHAILDKCSYQNIRPHSASIDMKVNVITGLILSIPSVMGILKRRNQAIDMFPTFEVLGEKILDPVHRDVALRSLIKFRRVCGPREFSKSMSRLGSRVQDDFRYLCEKYDEDSLDVYYAPKKINYLNNNNQLVNIYNGQITSPFRLSTDSSSEDSYGQIPFYNNNNFAKVIIETEIKFDSDTAITMTVLEENETESEKNTGSEEECDSSDQNMLKFSDADTEDTDVVVKKVRFGGESVKIRTPDSDNLISSEDDQNKTTEKDNIDVASIETTPGIVTKMNEIKREAFERESRSRVSRKSAIPLPVIQNKARMPPKEAKVKFKSKSLSELYDYFRAKNEIIDGKLADESGFALTVSEVQSPEKVPSPVEAHREVEVFHNLQRSPVLSPRRQQTRLQVEHNGFVLNVSSSAPDPEIVSPRPPSSLRAHYDWEDVGIVPRHVSDQLHNTENWIAAVKAADLLHGTLLEADSVNAVEPAALSLVQHMWALSDSVSAARAPAEGAVCALVRGASNDCVRQLLPSLVSRMTREPLPVALPQAMLQRLALHHLVDMIFDPVIIGVQASGDMERIQNAQLRAALCLARAAGPAAVLAAVRRRLAGTTRADLFCQKLRERLNRPVENIRPTNLTRISQLPVPVRRRARSTPPPTVSHLPRRLRPLPDSAPLLGNSQLGKDSLARRLSPIPLSDKDSSAFTSNDGNEKQDKTDIVFAATVDDEPPPQPRSPSMKIEDYSERSHRSQSIVSETKPDQVSLISSDSHNQFGSIQTLNEQDSGQRSLSRHSSPKSAKWKSSRSASPSPAKSRYQSPEPVEDYKPQVCERDVRNALAECVVPPKHEDWEVIVNGLVEMERLAADEGARAPAPSWRAAARSAATHVRSLRSRVARTACSTLGALFEHRGRVLDPELEEAATALLERCADVNKFLRADAAAALIRLACGSSCARVAVALCRRGAGHRAGPVRAAAAQAMARLARHVGAARLLELPTEPRTLLLRSAGELLGDASAETRAHGRMLCLALSDDARFDNMLKEAMPPNRYRAIEKYVDKLRCR